MVEFITVDDPTDQRLADYVALRDVELRKSLETESGLFIAEGEKVVRRAIAAGHQVRSFLMAERWIDGLEAEFAVAGDAPCYVVSEALAEEVTGFHVHRGALASLARKPLPPLDQVLAGAKRVVVLEDIVDHTNLGAIIRSAAALGIDAVLLSPRCADPLYRRSIKVAMGAVFAIPWTRLDDWYDAMADLSKRGFTTAALTLAPDAVTLDDFVAGKDLAIPAGNDMICVVLGSEGPGLSHRWQSSADVRVRIEMADGIDSLNVAAAAAIAFFAIGRGKSGPR